MGCQEKKQELGFQLKAVNNLIRRNLYVRFEQAGLSELVGMQGPMIGYLYDKGQERDVFQKDIERAFNIRRSTATVMLQTLEQKGYIVREPSRTDGRLKRIVLTDKAVEQNFRIRKQIDAFHLELEQGITPGEKAEFLRILEKIRNNLEGPEESCGRKSAE